LSLRIPPVATATAKSAAVAVAEVVEFYHPGLDHYFMTANPAEQAAVDSGAVGAWQRTGNTFPAGGPSPVCRFYGSLSPGPNSHFFTADAAECAGLKLLQATTPGTQKRWNFESNDFLTTPAVNGGCPSGLLPVYRAYNNGFARASTATIASRATPPITSIPWRPAGSAKASRCARHCRSKPAGAIRGLQRAGLSERRHESRNGPYLVNVIVEITNPGPTPIELVIPAGQTFVATPPFFQDGIAMERLAATIAPGTTRRFVLFLFCIEHGGDGSNTGTTYTLGPITTNAQLLDLIALTTDKLGASRDPQHIKTDAVQSAVWEITDFSGALTEEGRNILIALLNTPAADVATQAALYAQFKTTLTHPD
jgi:hypothetical protein